MRTLLLASAALLALGGAASAQNASGNPKSGAASNIAPANTRSAIAPALPSPGAGDANELLRRAEAALKAGRTGEAQEALERAETRILTRSTTVDAAGQPYTGPRVEPIRNARMALAHHDRAAALSSIQMAMNANTGTGDNSGAMAPAQSGGAGMPMQPGAGAGMPMGTTAAPSTLPGAGTGPASANGMNLNPNGQSGGGGNQSSGPANVQ